MVVLGGGQLLLDQPSTVWENGKLSGGGMISGELTVLGELLVGLIDPGPTAASIATTDAIPDTLQIDGGLALGPSSQLQIVLVGSGEYGQLNITGMAQLDGTLVLAFEEGYAPRAGDEFHFVNAESAAGAFTAVVVTGLADGWQYRLASEGGITTLVSTTDGIATTIAPPRTLYFPAVRTR
jgi:hypothetical protein